MELFSIACAARAATKGMEAALNQEVSRVAMRAKAYVESCFLIPIRRDSRLSDGDLHSTKAWNWLTDELFVRFAGCTAAPGLFRGFYRDPDTGTRVDDASRKYIVAVPKRRAPELRALLAEACRVFQQKCIYLSIAGHVEFVTASDA